VFIACLAGVALALVIGFALPERFRDWPAAFVLGSIGGLAAGISTMGYVIPAIADFLSPTSEPVKTDATDLLSRASEHGSAEPSHLWAILIGVMIGLIVAVAVWFVVACTTRLGMQVRTWTVS
jgi:flagellar biosynthesis protein FliR